MPSISSAGALRSSERSVSSCSDISVDGNLTEGGYLERSSTDNSVECYTTSSRKHMDDLIFPGKATQEVGGVSRSTEDTEFDDIRDKVEDNLDRHSSLADGKPKAFLAVDEVDASFWLPPEPEDKEDDIMGSVANYDDDECGDGGAWAKTSSLSIKFEEEKLKSMDDVKNGKFKILVSQLIKSVDIDTSGIYCENWVDIVTSLSWEAAAFVRPNSQEGTAMDPDGHVKLKCIATGSRNQSQVIKGLVFKKHAAHKHMQTKYKNPRLLLIYGSLDLSSAGLSSFYSMQQEKDNLKAIVEMIEKYHPNVILVEKSASRDILEFIHAKGITLISDMKLHRLERVAHCIGAPIKLSVVTTGQKLQQCDAFRIEKFVEELAVSADGGKKPSKTLMFLEGSPNRLGCTILLMGANSDELKRIKCAVRCAVVMAYHLMLETSFLLDQSAMLSTISPGEVVDLALTNNQSTSVSIDEATLSGMKDSDVSSNLDTIISNTLQGTGSHSQNSLSKEDSALPFVVYSTETFPGLTLSTSIKKVIDDSFPPGSDCSPSISALGFSGTNDDGHPQNVFKISGASEIVDINNSMPDFASEGENSVNIEQPYIPESPDMQNQSDSAEEQLHGKDEISSVLESESILVLMSTRNASRGTACEHSHFSHIKFYRSFDVPLGKFLLDNLLRQTRQCKTCSGSPEEHIFYYAHHNKQLSIQVRRLPTGRSLPGETGGKLWMWGRCGKCKLLDGSSKSSKRILLSSDASGLSFGKFLELSFSNQSSFSSLSSCGHSFDKDFLYFFGSGPMVALFTYSSVATHSVSLPSQRMEFNSSIRGEFIKRQYEDVHQKGVSMFRDIEESLKHLETRYVGVTLNILGTSKNFADIVDSLREEKSQFQVSIQNDFENASEEEVAGKLLRLNRIRMELMLESCLWDQRLHALLTSDFKVVDTETSDLHTTDHILKSDGIVEEDVTANLVIPLENTSEVDDKFDTLVNASDFQVKGIPIQGEEGFEEHGPCCTCVVTEDVSPPTIDASSKNGSKIHDCLAESSSENNFENNESGDGQENSDPSEKSRLEKTISVATDFEDVSEKNLSLSGKRRISVFSILENDKGWIWAPFLDIRREYMEDIQRGYLPKFDTFNSYAAESIPQKLITDESARLHIPLGSNDYIVSDYEDEFSSIIACALTFLKDRTNATEDLSEDARKERVDAKTNENSQSMIRSFSLNSPHWSSFGSSDSNGIQSPFAISSEDSQSSSFDGLDFLDSSVSYGAGHPQVSLGFGKNHGRRKYSVISLHASQFRQLRDRCCPSEFDYIASLSRCKNWDAKGGKSKSFFAKTLDDRLIIKEIKRTEFDSFLEFASSYFEYMNQCYDLGNQTCLAKILGIYQIATRTTKSGKESRHDLLVMENLSFGRHIARQYDLKGALHARFTSTEDGSGDVLLDQNFVNDMNVSPLYVIRKSKRILQRAVYNDTLFLNSINVMDYSLLVGVDTHHRELVCGIIDYLRQYTWDKQLENWVKSSLVVSKNQLPTIISPKEYKKRFRKFIDTHFLSVPDHWCSRRSKPCKLCGP